MAVYQSVRRARTECNMSGLEHVSRTAHRLNPFSRRDSLDVAAQPIDVDLDEVRERVELLVPDVLGDLLAGDDAAGVARQVLEHRVLFRGERERHAVDADA